MSNQAMDVTDAELAVLEQLWERPQASARELADSLYPESQSAQKTVKKLLERLESKRCVARDRSGRIQQFRAIVARDELIERRLTALAESLCEGSITPLLTQLVKSKKFSASDRKSLRSLIDQLDRSNKSSGNSKKKKRVQ